MAAVFGKQQIRDFIMIRGRDKTLSCLVFTMEIGCLFLLWFVLLPWKIIAISSSEQSPSWSCCASTPIGMGHDHPKMWANERTFFAGVAYSAADEMWGKKRHLNCRSIYYLFPLFYIITYDYCSILFMITNPFIILILTLFYFFYHLS